MDVADAGGRGCEVFDELEVDDGADAHGGEGGDALGGGACAAPEVGGDEAEVFDARDWGGEGMLGRGGREDYLRDGG